MCSSGSSALRDPVSPLAVAKSYPSAMAARRRPISCAVLLLVLLSACGASRTADFASQSAPEKPAPILLQTAAQSTEVRRDVIYTADLVIRVASIPKATAEATRSADDAGGFVFSQETNSSQTTLTLKVPTDRFDGVLAAVAGLGRELRRTVKAQDVTAEVVDVEGRLKTAQASADRLRSLLGEAKTAPEVVAVESELAKREADIESLQGRLRVLNDQVALATVSVRFTERDDLRVNNELPGFLGGLRAGWIALLNVGLALTAALGFVVPFVPFVVLVVWLLRQYRRRHPRPKPRPPAAPGWVPQPPPAAPGS